MMMRALSAAICLLALQLVGCAGRQASRLEGRYTLGDPGDGWKSVRPGGADFAWYNESLRATLYGDSNCADRYEDGPLRDLAKHLTVGIADDELVFEETHSLAGREAYTARRRGQLDGVPVEVGVTVLKKDQCVYDMVLIAPPGAPFEAAWSDFRGAVGDFDTKGS
jgi:hypothetical protein